MTPSVGQSVCQGGPAAGEVSCCSSCEVDARQGWTMRAFDEAPLDEVRILTLAISPDRWLGLWLLRRRGCRPNHVRARRLPGSA